VLTGRRAQPIILEPVQAVERREGLASGNRKA
jgi:NADH dehydrogenase